ncbi:MAG: phenylacetate--CoA ligase family protein [Bacteroidota bacterium]
MEKLYQLLPSFFQNVMITIYNIREYSKRYGGRYLKYRQQYLTNRSLSLSQLEEYQKEKFVQFVQHAIQNSTFYRDSLKGIEIDFNQLAMFPIIGKELLRQHIKDIYTISKSKAILSKTGGTTGKSLEVYFTHDNMQDRFALLDDFRSRYGYELGKKTAWFSGKNLLTSRDVKKNRFWKTDYWYKVRYYSTFHIKREYLKYYIEDLIRFKPEYMVGFPSSIMEIAKFGLDNDISFPPGIIKAVFPTAETITPTMREIIETFFKTRLYNQYASSEGAPWIFECKNGNLHLELQSGVFEVLDENNQPAKSGRLIVTSFTTEGTPLIRYDIGDSLTLEDEHINCDCGNNNPLAKEILGRIDDYIYSPKNGKINLGNVSNTLKGTYGILKFQAIQNELDKIAILVVVDNSVYNKSTEEKFIQNWKDRVGDDMLLTIQYVEDIPVEKSGKYRIVKNNIKHLIN